MELTIDAIKEAVEKQPDLKTGLISSFKDDFVTGADGLGLIVRSKEDDQSYLTNHVNTVMEAEVTKRLKPKLDEEFSKTMSKIDEKIQTITGIPKNAGEKTTDYAQRAIASKSADPVTKDKLIELQNQLAQKDQDYEKKISEVTERLERREREYEVNGGLVGKTFPLPAHLKTDEEKTNYQETQKRFIKNDFFTRFTAKRDAEGNTVYYEGDKPLMNTKDGKPKTATQIIDESYSSFFLQNGRQASGTGQGGAGAVPNKGEFKNKEDIHKYLAATGLDAGSGEYRNQLEALAKEANISLF